MYTYTHPRTQKHTYISTNSNRDNASVHVAQQRASDALAGLQV